MSQAVEAAMGNIPSMSQAIEAAMGNIPSMNRVVAIEMQNRMRLFESNISASIVEGGHYQSLSELVEAGHGDLIFSELVQHGLIVLGELAEGNVAIDHTEFSVVRQYELFGFTPKEVITYMFNFVLLPLILSIFLNTYLQPEIDNIRSTPDLSPRQQNKEIAHIPATTGLHVSSDSRFISADQVRLRRGPSMKSEVLTELDRGSILTFVRKSKTRKWTEVRVSVNGIAVQGWVFSRYVSRFIYTD